MILERPEEEEGVEDHPKRLQILSSSGMIVSMDASTPCAFCDAHDATYGHVLKETEEFRVVCDPYPLIEGHILIIPKRHIACIGACSIGAFREFMTLYTEVGKFLQKNYGALSSFEHGDIGHSVPHAHMHLLPCEVSEKSVIPEGESHLEPLMGMAALRSLFAQRNHYLFFSTGAKCWTVDSDLAKPRFFRDRLAIVLGRPQRGNWKAMSSIPKHMDAAAKEIASLEKKWNV